MEEKTCFGIEMSAEHVLENLERIQLLKELYLEHIKEQPLAEDQDLFVFDTEEQIKALKVAIEAVKALQELNAEVVHAKN